MKKSLLLFAIFTMVGGSLFAQLSTRENNAVNVRLNTRPQAGDAALQFVFPIVDLSANNGSDAGLYSGNFLSSGDMLTFKHYKTDNLVYRGAFRFYADNDKSNGTSFDDDDVNPVDTSNIETFKMQSIDRQYNIAGGVEKHFSNSNIFDVYVGAEALVGLGKVKELSEETYYDGDIENISRTTNTTVFGFAGVVGFNVFVAELPVSLGLEYGWGGKWIFGGSTKVKEERDLDGTNYTVEYLENPDVTTTDGATKFSDLSRRQFNMDTNQSVRLNVHIYFGSK